jgi:methionyl-tRNA formyltransferase
MAERRTVCLMGKGDLAIQIGEYFLNDPTWSLDMVVVEFPEPSWTKSLADWAVTNGIPVHNGKVHELESDFDLGFSCFHGSILKESDLAKFSLALNLHNGPLPRYRGVNPINWALRNNEKFHGVTIHKIDLGVDSGPIYGQVMFPINPASEEVEDVYDRALMFGYTLFKDVISRVWILEPIPQDESKALIYTRNDFEALGDRKYFTKQQS